MAITPRINLSITRVNGHTSQIKTAAKAPPTPAMIAMAEALAEFVSTGVNPLACCAACGRRRDFHADVRHVFVEP
jgi:hypothetical protein